mgnify:CR=1 FL=1|jgi:hypothetical protein
MQKKRSIQLSSAVIALLCIASLLQTLAETSAYRQLGADEQGAVFGFTVLATIVTRVVIAGLTLVSSVFFFQHREAGRKGLLVAAYTLGLYLGYVFVRLSSSSGSWVFLLIGLGNILLIALFIRWLRSEAIRSAVE